CVEKNNNVWVANEVGGIAVYRGGEKIKQITPAKDEAGVQSISSLYKSKGNDDIWVGTAKGKIYSYNSRLDTFTEPDCFKHIENVPVYNLFEDSKGNLWIASDKGL